jgi:1-deoxy-D-xylulose-5-phosphate reductoisomerase
MMRRLIILGSTGSIGTQALDVVRRHPDRFEVVGLAAASSHELLTGQVREFMPPVAAVSDETAAVELKAGLERFRSVEILAGPNAPEQMARDLDADLVLNAMVGSAGLEPTLAALQSGKTLALANKESLVVGGELVMDLVKAEPERLVPVDSEHSALAQALRGDRREDLARVIITASGGPFRGWSHEELGKASVKEALAHPTWRMGPKITIDSATLMNKGLEVIEAHYLFGLDYSEIDIVVHPESIAESRLPGWARRADLPRGPERGERGCGDGLPRGEDPADGHPRPGQGRPRRARSSGRLGGPDQARRRVGPATRG